MALRRVLPSRQPDAASSDTSTAPIAAPAPQQPLTAAPLPTPVAAPSEPEPAKPSQAEMAAVASSAFSTLPTAPVVAPAVTVAAAAEIPLPVAPARVLEDSFVVAAPVQPQAAAGPIAVSPAAPQPIIPSISDFQPAAAPEPQAEVPAPVAVPAPAPVAPQPAPSRPDENRFKRQVGNKNSSGNRDNNTRNRNQPPRGDGPRTEAPRPQPTPAPQVDEPTSTVITEFLAETAPVAAPTTLPQPAEEPRRNRVKRERDFAAATIDAPAADQPTLPSSGTAALAKSVPVNTRPLDKVDEELIASGIIAGPPGDSLTSSVPASLAVAEEQYDPTELEAPMPPREDEAPLAEPQPFLAPLPSSSSASFTPTSAPLPTPTSDLPWASNTPASGWEVELPAAPAEAAPITAAPPPPGDFFKPLANSPATTAPAWASGSRQNVPPPELPGNRGIHGPSMGKSGTPIWGIGVAGLAVAIVAFFLWNSSSTQQNQLQEKVARWTGSLKENTENLPPELGGTTATAGQNLVKPEGTFSMTEFHTNPNGSAGALLPPPVMAAGATPPPAGSVSSSAQIAFADVAPDQAGKPIVADGSEKMPEDVSLFAKFQQAVAEARAQKQAAGGVSGTVAPKQVASADKTEGGPLTPEKLNEELSAYRKSLVDAPTAQAAPKPTEFAKDPAAYMDGKDQLASGASTGTLQPPPATAAENAKGAAPAAPGMLPPPELYTNNPKNLPIVGEPVANAPARVRTLADFEVEPFSPEVPKVLIPRNLKPKMAATDFPSLQVLSFVQGKGIIANVGGREGVLLIGETMEGWELTNVTPELAEFRAGQKRHYITVND